jgi:DNA-binding MarR family transcriptional regulator
MKDMDDADRINQIKDLSSFLIARICHSHRYLVQTKLSQHNLYVGQEMFLLPLWEQDGQNLTQLAETLCVKQATVSRMLDRIEGSGWVTRVKDPDDGRVSLVYLTEEGRDLLEPIVDMWQEVDAVMLQGFTLEERLLLRRLLIQVYTNLSE